MNEQQEQQVLNQSEFEEQKAAVRSARAAATLELIDARNVFVPEWLGMHCAQDSAKDDEVKQALGTNAAYALSAQSNLESLGFGWDAAFCRALSWQPISVIAAVYSAVDLIVRKKVGAHRVFNPLYPNFPQQVMDASEVERWANAQEHYANGGHVPLSPEGIQRDESQKEEKSAKKTRTLRALSGLEAVKLVIAMAASPVSMGSTERTVISAVWALAALETSELLSTLVDCATTLSNKENQAFMAAEAAKHGVLPAFAGAMQTATDALRLAVALSQGDVSLAQPSKLINFSRPTRRLLMAIVERHLEHGDADQAVEDLFARREQWLRWGERVHPSEWKKAFPLTGAAFEALRANQPPPSWNSKVDWALSSQTPSSALSLLVQRPGVLARRAHHVARTFEKTGEEALLVSALQRVASSVATSVLLQAHAHFQAELSEEKHVRVFMPKGGLGRVFVPQEPSVAQESLKRETALALLKIYEDALIERFKKMPAMGNVWVDPALDNIVVPFAMRSASRGVSSLARGSRVDAQESIQRLFLWWSESGKDKNGAPLKSSRIDVDLSVLMLDANFQSLGHVSWTALAGSGVTHSGDITSAPNGACEFIDVNYSKLDPKIAYIAMTAFSFTGQTFAEMPECFVGWMGREHAMKGKFFDARSVRGRSDCAMESTACMPALLDVSKRQMVLCDLSLGSSSNGWNTIEKMKNTIGMTVQGIAMGKRPTLGQLIKLHVQARGALVSTPEEADRCFGLEQGTTPWDLEAITGEFLALQAPEGVMLSEQQVVDSQDLTSEGEERLPNRSSNKPKG